MQAPVVLVLQVHSVPKDLGDNCLVQQVLSVKEAHLRITSTSAPLVLIHKTRNLKTVELAQHAQSTTIAPLVPQCQSNALQASSVLQVPQIITQPQQVVQLVNMVVWTP